MSASRFVLIAVALCVCGQGQESTSAQHKVNPALTAWKTGRNWNGRFWKALEKEEKRGFLLGYAEAAEFMTLLTASNHHEYTAKRNAFWPQSLSFDEVVASLDHLYEDPANASVEIVFALMIVAQRANGVPEEAAQKMMLDLRLEVLKRTN